MCQETKVKAAQAKRRDPTVAHAPLRFGDLVLGDHLVMPGEDHHGNGGQTAGLLLKGVGTNWRDCVATVDKGSLESQRVMREFTGRQRVSEFYSDCSKELKAAAKVVHWSHALATPHRPTSRGERENQLVLESSRCALAAIELPLSWWPRCASHTSAALSIHGVKHLP